MIGSQYSGGLAGPWLVKQYGKVEKRNYKVGENRGSDSLRVEERSALRCS